MGNISEMLRVRQMNEVVIYQPTNAGDLALVEQSTNDIQLVTMWATKPRKSQSQNTIEQYMRQGRAFLAEVGKPLQAINYQDLQKWQAGLTGSINTQRLKVNAIKSLFSFAHKLGYIRVNPGIMLEPPHHEETKHTKMLTEEQVVRLVNADLSDRDEAIIRVMYNSACRVSELVNLRWQDVIPTANGKAVLVIRGKGGKTRESGIKASAYVAMLKLKTEDSQPDDYIFQSNRHQQMDRKTVNHLFKKLSKVIGQDVTPHFMRHSHISHALEHGQNPVTVMNQAGHSSLQVTTGYAHADGSSADCLIV